MLAFCFAFLYADARLCLRLDVPFRQIFSYIYVMGLTLAQQEAYLFMITVINLFFIIIN